MRLIMKNTWVAFLVLVISACSTIAPYSQTAYEQATSLKAEVLILMDKATEQYSAHKAEAEVIQLDMEKAYEYSKGRPKNEISTKQWEIVRNPNRNSLGGFLKHWKANGTLNQSFITEAKGLISDQLDTVIGLESGKIKPEGLTAK